MNHEATIVTAIQCGCGILIVLPPGASPEKVISAMDLHRAEDGAR